jgi:hypothetical protein
VVLRDGHPSKRLFEASDGHPSEQGENAAPVQKLPKTAHSTGEFHLLVSKIFCASEPSWLHSPQQYSPQQQTTFIL